MRIYMRSRTRHGRMSAEVRLRGGETEKIARHLFERGGEQSERLRNVSAAVRIANAVIRRLLSMTLSAIVSVLPAALLSIMLSVTLLLLSSCSFIPGYTEPEDQYIVSALGFDMVDGMIEVSAQMAAEDGSSHRVYKGLGESVEYAVSHLKGTDAKRIETGHCAVILIGESVDGDRLVDILDFCRRNGDITIGVRVATVNDAGMLLSMEGIGGYELTRAMREGEDGNGICGDSRFYEIEDIRRAGGVIALPHFVCDGEEWSLWGLRLFRNGERLTLLDRGESAVYSMVSGGFKRGKTDLTVDGVEYSAFVSSCKTSVTSEEGEGEIRVKVTCRLRLDEETLPPIALPKIEDSLSDEAERLCGELWERYGDVFGFSRKVGAMGVPTEKGEIRVVLEG